LTEKERQIAIPKNYLLLKIEKLGTELGFSWSADSSIPKLSISFFCEISIWINGITLVEINNELGICSSFEVSL